MHGMQQAHITHKIVSFLTIKHFNFIAWRIQLTASEKACEHTSTRDYQSSQVKNSPHIHNATFTHRTWENKMLRYQNIVQSESY